MTETIHPNVAVFGGGSPKQGGACDGAGFLPETADIYPFFILYG